MCNEIFRKLWDVSRIDFMIVTPHVQRNPQWKRVQVAVSETLKYQKCLQYFAKSCDGCVSSLTHLGCIPAFILDTLG